MILRYLLIIFLYLFIPFQIFASSFLYFTEPPKNIEVGERFTIYLRLRATDEAINAISAVISFPPNLVKPISTSKEGSIINLWTGEPKIFSDRISFEGVVLNPGFSGNNGLLLKVVFEAKSTGVVNMNFIEGATLANDGLGSNILATLSNTNFRISPFTVSNNLAKNPTEEIPKIVLEDKFVKLPVITEYQEILDSKENIRILGKGEPNSLTRIIFKDISLRSLGEEFLNRVQNKKVKLDSILVKNDENGDFNYISPKNLVAGVYNATPFFVDEEANIEKPGLGKQILVQDSKVVKNLVIFINVLTLFIPIVLLSVIIYFIPWYSWLRMRLLKKKMHLEEEKVELTGIKLLKEEELDNKKDEKEL